MMHITPHIVRQTFCLTARERIEEHRGLLKKTSSQAASCPLLYGQDLPVIDAPERMSGLPLIFSDRITRVLSSKPLSSVLLQEADYSFSTSGYSGISKTFHYTAEDAALFADIWACYAWLVGVRSGSSFWNFGSKLPMISAKLLQLVRDRFETDREIYTPIKDGMDFLKALKKASRSKGADVIAGPTIAYYLMCRAVRDPDYMLGSVRRVLKNDMHLPSFLSGPLAKLLLQGFDARGLQQALSRMYMGFSYAEPLSSYREMIEEHFPNIRMYDVYGSTEVPIIAATLEHSSEDLALMLPAHFAELADPLEVHKARKDPSHRVETIPWYRWEEGMTGELIITRQGGALPLFRYATGDLLKVIDPLRSFMPESTRLFPREFSAPVPAPAIQVMARSADVMDFETEEEMGSFMGKKIYSPQIQKAIGNLNEMLWWELFKIRNGDNGPGPLIFLVYPESSSVDVTTLVKTVREHLLYRTPDETDTFKTADSMGLFEIRILHPQAYEVIQSEIMDKLGASSLGQLKPRHIFTVENRLEFSRKTGRRLMNALN